MAEEEYQPMWLPLSPWGNRHAGATPGLVTPPAARGIPSRRVPTSLPLTPGAIDPSLLVGLPPVVPTGGFATSADPFVNVTVTLPDGTRVSHVARVANATADLGEAQRIAATRETVDGQRYGLQIEATRSLYAALGRFYQDANVIPMSDPLYVQWWLDWFVGNGESATAGFNAMGKVTPTDPAWSRENGVGRVNLGRQSPGPSEFETRMRQQWQRMGKTLVDSLHDFCGFRMRFMLDDQGNLLEQCLNYGVVDDAFGRSIQRETDCVDWSWTGQVEDGASLEGHESDARTWKTILWNKRPEIGIPAGNWCALDDVLAPVRWFFDAAIDLVNRLSSRPRDGNISVATATWMAAVVYSTMWNLRAADELGVLPADLRDLAANLPRNVALSRVAAQQANLNAALQFSAVAMQVGSMAGPQGTAFAAIISAIAIAFAALAPGAVGTSVDYFGRDLPFAMRVDMQGETEVTPPSQTNRPQQSGIDSVGAQGVAAGTGDFAMIALGAIVLGVLATGGKHGL